MSRHILSLHRDFVNAWIFVAMLDGLICHRQVLVDGPNPIAEVHLVLGAAGVTLLGKEQGLSAGWKQMEDRRSDMVAAFILPAPGEQ